ncbi:acyl-CoA N-acyltransferase [Cyathus striatus]|nr:acyl-CoA N-acyltransferase [Cyathus striatus]
MKNLVIVRDLSEMACFYYEEFLHLFAIMQSATIEASNPTYDFPTFSGTARYFGALFEAPELMPSWREEDGEVLTTFPSANEDDTETYLVGFIYLCSMQNQNLMRCPHGDELSIGVVLKPEFQGLGYARLAVNHMVDVTFRDAVCHRIQALIMDSKDNSRAMALFVKCGFTLEGTRRQSFFGPYDNTWKDITCLSILDTDYVARRSHGVCDATVSLWENMLHRHEEENEQISRIIQGPEATLKVAPTSSLQHEINATNDRSDELTSGRDSLQSRADSSSHNADSSRDCRSNIRDGAVISSENSLGDETDDDIASWDVIADFEAKNE